MLAHLRDANSAVVHYRASLEIDPDNAPAWTTLGYLLLNQRQQSEAVDCFRQALRIDPHLEAAQRGLRQAGG